MVAKALPSERQVDAIRRAYAPIHTLAQQLEPDGRSGTEVHAAVDRWQQELDSSLGATARERAWREHFKGIVHAFGKRIFTCYDHPLIPRTNNDLEQALRALSRHERRITGRKHVGPRLVRTPGLVGAGALLAREPAPAQHVARLPHAQRRGFQTRRRRRSKPRGQGLAFRRTPAEFLAALEEL